jgi:hypothetical protein
MDPREETDPLPPRRRARRAAILDTRGRRSIHSRRTGRRWSVSSVHSFLMSSSVMPDDL